MNELQPTGTRLPLTVEVVRQRLVDHVYVLYLNASFFIKGAVIAVAALSFYYIWMPDVVTFRYERMALWLGSLGFSVITIATWARGAALTNARANLLDILMPIAIGICEVLFYTVVTPPSGSFIGSDRAQHFWLNWYLVFGAHALFAVFLIATRLRAAQPPEFAGAALEPIRQQYRDWLIFDLWGAAATSLAGFAMYAACMHYSYLQTPAAMPFHVIAGFIVFGFSLWVMGSAMYQYKALSRM